MAVRAVILKNLDADLRVALEGEFNSFCLMDTGEPDQEPEVAEVPIDPAVTPDLFREWRSPRFGQSNPQRMSNPVWEWLIRSRLSAYTATERLNGPDAVEAGPGWCFDRFGQSSTQLPDGRTVLIAGEHEDHYDPDFYIYNDVVILHPDGSIDIFGYPKDIFPPTDFHSATLVDDRIILIGNLGYHQERRPGTTPVLALEPDSFAISSVPTVGTPPGWIHEHEATLSESGNAILIRCGKLDRGGEDNSLVENIDDWVLRLPDWRWERLTERRWQRWEVFRRDRKATHFWEIQQAVWSQSVRWDKELEEQMARLSRDLVARPDLGLVAKLFCPPLPHKQLPRKDDEHNIFRIEVDGIVVRYVEDIYSIQITVEGELPQGTVEVMTSDLVRKMSTLENAPFDLRRL